MTIFINKPGVFNLTRDLNENIIVGVAGVTINGNGFTVHGKDDDELVANAQKHVSTSHPEMTVTREQFLAMAAPQPQGK